jgi:hypothetical protein
MSPLSSRLKSTQSKNQHEADIKKIDILEEYAASSFRVEE